jgi:tRNA(Ile)-lysidine synthase TilS/MesJ
MALAWLLKQLPKRDQKLLLEPIAFIVDHKARNGSREEAEFVSRELEKIGTTQSCIDFLTAN